MTKTQDMASPASARLDSVVAAQDVENAQLKFEIQSLQQECREWKTKHVEAKDEVHCLSGSAGHLGRQVKLLQDECANIKSQLVRKDEETIKLRGELLKATRRGLGKLQSASAETSVQSLSRKLTGRPVSEDLEVARVRIADLEQENNKLKTLHEEFACEEIMLVATQQVTDAQRLQQAAEAENEANRHLRNGIELIKQQNTSVHELLNEASLEIRQKDAKIQQLELSVVHHSADGYEAEHTVIALQRELHLWKPRTVAVNCKYGGLHAINPDTPSTSSSSDQEPKPLDTLLAKAVYIDSGTDAFEVPKQALARIDTDLMSDTTTNAGIQANIIINIEPTQQKNWNILKRVQAVIAKPSTLDILGPNDLVQDLLAAMKHNETDHTEATAAATHWQKVATEALTEVDTLRETLQAKLICAVPGHRRMKDELEAKDMQLLMQGQLVAKWQRKLAGVKAAMDQASMELREGNPGIRAP
jgi:hypothetical protein